MLSEEGRRKAKECVRDEHAGDTRRRYGEARDLTSEFWRDKGRPAVGAHAPLGRWD
jgi:hypothetical protein